MAGLTLAVGAAGISLLALVGYGAGKLCANTKLFNRITACFKKYFCCCLPNSNLQLSGNQNQSSNEEDINEPLPRPPKPSPKPPGPLSKPLKPQVPAHSTIPPTHSPNINLFNYLKPTQLPVPPPPSPPSFVPSPSFPQHPQGQAGRRIVNVHYQSNGDLLSNVKSFKDRIRTDLRDKNNIELIEQSTAVDAHFQIFIKYFTLRPGVEDVASFFRHLNHGAMVFCQNIKNGSPDALPAEKIDDRFYKLKENHKIFTILFNLSAEGTPLHTCDYNQPHIKDLTGMIEASIPSSPQDG